VSLVSERVVCANTLGIAEQQMDGRPTRKIEIRHTGDAPAKIGEAARELFGACVENFEIITQHYGALRRFTLSEEAYRELVVDAIARDPRRNPRFNPDARLAEMVVTRYERKKREVTRLWTEGDGHVGDHSAWEAYNGAVQALDHDRELFPTRAGSYRTASLLDGILAETKQRILDNLIAHVRQSRRALPCSSRAPGRQQYHHLRGSSGARPRWDAQKQVPHPTRTGRPTRPANFPRTPNREFCAASAFSARARQRLHKPHNDNGLSQHCS
jgi:hypothetical protein